VTLRGCAMTLHQSGRVPPTQNARCAAVCVCMLCCMLWACLHMHWLDAEQCCFNPHPVAIFPVVVPVIVMFAGILRL